MALEKLRRGTQRRANGSDTGEHGMTEQSPRGSIVLAVHNGAPYLPQQLESFAAQTLTTWDLIVGDDGSTDDSPALLEAFAEAQRPLGHAVTLLEGPQRGGSAHFLTLLSQVPGSAAWAAFSDQDDVWVPEKLSRALAMLETVPSTEPALYCSRTWVTGPALEAPHISRAWPRPFGFLNALVQNIASGNTIVLNRAGIELAQRAVPGALAVADLPAHDWWLYQILTGAEGHILHDDRPGLYYRQHQQNQIGANYGLGPALRRARAIWAGGYAAWNAANIAALQGAGTLTPENTARLEAFASVRTLPFPKRLAAMKRLGVYRQTPLTQAALWLAAALGRL